MHIGLQPVSHTNFLIHQLAAAATETLQLIVDRGSSYHLLEHVFSQRQVIFEVKQFEDLTGVNRILDDFKSGRRDEASFWIDLPGKTAYIRYFPVKDKAGSYLGTIEVSQDIKPIRELDGEKRLLDEETKDPHS